MPYYPEKRPLPPGEEPPPPGKPAEKRRKLLRLCIFVLSGILMLYGSIRLIQYVTELNASRETARELRAIYEQSAPESEPVLREPERTAAPFPSLQPSPEDPEPAALPAGEGDGDQLPPVPYPANPGRKLSDRFRQLQKKSDYIIGWLQCDQVDEPVVWKDNTFFLNHDATGKKNGNGAIFLDAGISLLTRPYTLILYGHNMKSGNMFGRLKKYKENTYLHRNRIITFESIYEDGQYAVFAVMEMSTLPGTARWYDLWSLTSDSRAERTEAIINLERHSVINTALDVGPEDQLLLLVTCLDGEDDRLVVAARRLREGEAPDRLTLR